MTPHHNYSFSWCNVSSERPKKSVFLTVSEIPFYLFIILFICYQQPVKYSCLSGSITGYGPNYDLSYFFHGLEPEGRCYSFMDFSKFDIPSSRGHWHHIYTWEDRLEWEIKVDARYSLATGFMDKVYL